MIEFFAGLFAEWLPLLVVGLLFFLGSRPWAKRLGGISINLMPRAWTSLLQGLGGFAAGLAGYYLVTYSEDYSLPASGGGIIFWVGLGVQLLSGIFAYHVAKRERGGAYGRVARIALILAVANYVMPAVFLLYGFLPTSVIGP